MNNEKTMIPSTSINLIDYSAAAALLGIRPQSLRRLVSQRRIPHLHVGRLVRFDVQDLQEFLNSQKVPVGKPRVQRP
ncbi:MAG: helix-turn-helix domain-containing protein [Spirochaetia bacterium]|jgi:excisionase family DNA binding protein